MNQRELKTLIDLVESPPTKKPTKYLDGEMLYDKRNNRLGLYVKGLWRYFEFREGAAAGAPLPALIDISDDTNLAVTSPITLSGDTVGFGDPLLANWDAGNFLISAFGMLTDYILDASDSFTIPDGKQMVIADSFEINGTLTVNGRLGVV